MKILNNIWICAVTAVARLLYCDASLNLHFETYQSVELVCQKKCVELYTDYVLWTKLK